jgi:predicted nucleotidyltransferase
VTAALDSFTRAAIACFGTDLVSVVLFGSAVDGRLRATSDVNVILVLARAKPEQLTAIGPAYAMAHAAIRLSVMFLLEAEIPSASEAFAVKFADVATRHRILHGPDPFADLVIDRDAARRRLGQILVNLTLRLRERLALDAAFEEQLAMVAADSVGPLRSAAATLVSLESGAQVAPREALAALAAPAGLTDAVATITKARESGTVPESGGVAAVTAAMTLAGLIASRVAALPTS